MVVNFKTLRKKIDAYDNSLMNILSSRFRVVRRVGRFKKSQGMPLCDRKRQAEVLKIRIKQGKSRGLNSSFVKKLYNLIFNEALRIQRCD